MPNYALAIEQYVKARMHYRSFSGKNRPPEVVKAFESAKRRLGKVRGEPNCASPHLNTEQKGCSSCAQPCYRRARMVL